MRQFKRYINLKVGGLSIDNLHMSFDISKDNGKSQNTLNMSVINLSSNSANKLTQKYTPIELDCGYTNSHGILFSGFIREISRTRVGADIVTEIEAGDGDSAYHKAYTNKTHGSGTSLKSMIRHLVNSMDDVVIGDLSSIDDVILPRPFSAIGQTVDSLDLLATRFGFEWSIQDGVLNCVSYSSYTNSKTILSASSGLLGLPSIERDNKVSIKCLINHNLKINSLIEITGINKSLKLQHTATSDNHSVATGLYRIDEISHYGSNYENSFYSEITKARRILNGKTQHTNRSKQLRKSN